MHVEIVRDAFYDDPGHVQIKLTLDEARQLADVIGYSSNDYPNDPWPAFLDRLVEAIERAAR